MEKLEGIELTPLARDALKWYCDQTKENPEKVLLEAVQQFVDRKKLERARNDDPEGCMLTVQVMLYRPFTDFAREYLRFFGDKQTVETFCTLAVYEKCNSLHRDLTLFVNNKTHGLDAHAWYEKHSHIAITASAPEDEDESE